MIPCPPRLAAMAALMLCCGLLGACSALRPTATPPPTFYALQAPPPLAPTPRSDSAVDARPTLIITPPRAASGFDSQRIIFVRGDHQLEYFAHSEWVDTPARMLGPWLAAALESTGSFGAVVLTPTSAAADWRLDTEIIRLQQDFRGTPSHVQFALRATLVDERTRRVLGSREFQAEAAAPADSPQGGVAAANQAVQDALAQLTSFVQIFHKAMP